MGEIQVRERKKSALLQRGNPLDMAGGESLAVTAMVDKTADGAGQPEHNAPILAPPAAVEPVAAKQDIPTAATPAGPTALPAASGQVETAPDSGGKSLDVWDLVRRAEWPIGGKPNLSYFKGDDELPAPREDVPRTFNLRLKEPLFLTIQAHCKRLGLNQSDWAKMAFEKMLESEQKFFLEAAKEK